MDPNLQKIRDANMSLIKRGRLGIPILQAKDYLFYILGNQLDQINLEMDEYVDQLKQIAKKHKKTTRKSSD